MASLNIQCIDRAAYNQIHMRAGAKPVPDVLHAAIYGRIDIIELLKLVDDQIELVPDAQLHNKFKKPGETVQSARYGGTQYPGDRFRKLHAQVRFVASFDKPIQGRTVLATVEYEACLPYSSASRQYGKFGMVRKSQIAYILQFFQFVCPIVEFHKRNVFLAFNETAVKFTGVYFAKITVFEVKSKFPFSLIPGVKGSLFIQGVMSFSAINFEPHGNAPFILFPYLCVVNQ